MLYSVSLTFLDLDDPIEIGLDETLAERDLALRGSGELLGTQQSGFSTLRALDPVEDLELLLQERKAVRSED